MININDYIMSVQKACRIITCFSHDKTKLTLAELCKITGYPKSTVHRICNTLLKEGFLISDKESNTYSLSLVLYQLGSVALQMINIREIIKKIMVDIVDDVKETSALYVCNGYKRICIEKVESPYEVRQVVTLGRPLPLYLGASGKVLLAWMQPDKRKEFFRMLEQDPPSSIKGTVHQFEKYLDIVKEQGYCMSFGERIPDSKAVSVPIIVRSEVMALTLLGPGSRIDDAKLELMKNTLLSATKKINSMLK